MIGIKAIFVVLFLAVASVFGQIENGWKNIKVFETTHYEVERILGKPSPDSDEIYTIYPSPDGYVDVSYSNAPALTPRAAQVTII